MIDWRRIRLVAFDVDGTLYAQRPVRARMAAALAVHTLASGSLRTINVLKTYRTLRETLGSAETVDFDQVLLAQVGRRHGLGPDQVGRVVAEWIEERPLSVLAGCRYAAVDRLFNRVRHSGRTVGILSDYPAHGKLRAMGLEADHVVSASEVGVLKPHPRGLCRLMELAEATPEQTILIGDRLDRDGEAARRAGSACLLRSTRPIRGIGTFSRFDDPIFAGLDQAPAHHLDEG